MVLLGLSGAGISFTALNFGRPVKLPPVHPTINNTEDATTPKPSGYYYDRDRVTVPKEIQKYSEATRLFSDHSRYAGVFLIVPCGVCAIIAASLILGGLCSRKIFSTTIGLYSSLALWIITLASLIIFQNTMASILLPEDLWAAFPIVCGIQAALLVTITIQILLAYWELRQQKIGWPVFHLSHLFTLNTVMLVTRITVGVFALSVLISSDFWFGLPEFEKYRRYYSYSYDFYVPRIKWPDYYAYPTVIALLYNIIVSSEALLSHGCGYLHTKMLCLSTLMSTIFYGGIVVVTSPVFTRRQFNSSVNAEVMNWSIGAMLLCLFQAVFCIAKPKAMNTPPAFILAMANHLGLTAPTTIKTEGLKNSVAVLRSKFKGSDTLLYNTVLLVLNILAIILQCVNFDFNFSGTVMICGNIAMVNRILPSLIMEALMHKVESVPVFKMLVHFLIECVMLIIGICSYRSWYYGERSVASFVNILVVILQFYKLVTNPAIKASAITLATQESGGTEASRLISQPEDDESDHSTHNEDEPERTDLPIA